MSLDKLISSSLLLFVDQLTVAGGNWFYWLIISRMISDVRIRPGNNGSQHKHFHSLLIELGLEYPLLKKVIKLSISLYLGTTLVLELAIALASIPFIIYFFNGLPQELHHTSG